MELKDHAISSPHPNLALSPGIASADDYAYCRMVMRKASNRYSFASSFLPTEKRQHVEALYAFLRIGDDRVDVSYSGFSSPKAAIEDWENQYHRTFEIGDSPNPVMRAYLNTAINFGIPQNLMDSYFRAMRDDMHVSRFSTFSDLLRYMEGSAITVGRAMTYILGVRHPHNLNDALPYADNLSVGMQLSNFLRDIDEDFHLGRIYLPLEDLHEFSVTEADFSQRRVSPQFIDLLEFEIERAMEYYSDAKPGVEMLDSGRWGIMSGLVIYRAILDDIRRINYDVFHKRADISLIDKFLLVGKSLWMVSTGGEF